MILNLLKNQRGAAAVEYALLAVLIAAVVAASVIVLGNKVEQLFKSVVF
jgi:Flp pilus assembly pilin Flp